MLDLSQDALAQECGLSLNTIHSLEKGQVSYRSSMEVRRTLEKKGIEFLGNNGLSRRDDTSITYTGEDGTDNFYEDMLATVKESGGEIVAEYRTAEVFARSLGISSSDKQDRIEQLSKYASVRCLISNANQSSLTIPSIRMRATSYQLPMPLSTFTCGNKHTVVITPDGIKFFYYVMRSVEVVQCELHAFAAHWDRAHPLVSSKP